MLVIYPASLSGSITAPASKSLTHRFLIACALAKQSSEIINPLIAEDTAATIQVLEQLGVDFVFQQNGALTVIPPQKFSNVTTPIDCKESGSTLRFLIPLFLHLQKEAAFSGSQRLMERLDPNDLQSIGISFEKSENLLKVKIAGFPNQLTMSDSSSTQLISGVLLTAPLFNKQISITVLNPVLDPYLSMTLAVLKIFRVKYTLETNPASYTITIPKNQNYIPTQIKVEGDYSQMANFLVAGSLGRGVTVHNLSYPSVQGDHRIVEILQTSGAEISVGDSWVSVQPSTLKPFRIDLTHIPDLGPILMGLASTIEGTSSFTGLKRLIKKESNRLLSTIRILNQFRVKTVLSDDTLTITGQSAFPGGITINPDNDHRLAMLVASLASRFEQPVKLTTPKAVDKSYPHFWEDYQALGGKISWED